MTTAVACPPCHVPAEITDRFSLSSTDGPVAHVAVSCAAGHHFRMPADRLPVRPQPPQPVGLVPGLVAACILCLQLAWNDFLFAAVLTNNATRTLPVLMAAFSGGDTGVDWGGMTASGVLVILPVILFSFAAQRHLVAGLSSGAVKG